MYKSKRCFYIETKTSQGLEDFNYLKEEFNHEHYKNV